MGMVLGSLTILSSVSAVPIVDSFGVFKRDAYNQNTSGSTNAGSFSFFYAEVSGSNLDEFSTLEFTGGVEGTVPLTPAGRIAQTTRTYFTPEDRNTAYPTGNYTMTLDAESVTLTITEDTFPNVGEITGGTWDPNGDLLVTDSGYTFNFVTPVGVDLVRLSFYQRDGDYKQFYYEGDGSTTSFVVPDAELELGLQFGHGAALDFIKFTDTDTAFGGAAGYAGYMNRTSFEFEVVSAVPEPSTYALLAGALALGVSFNRRRK